MFRLLRSYVLALVFVSMTSFAQAQETKVTAVIKYRDSNVTVFESGSGGAAIETFATSELHVPTLQISEETDFGLVKVEIQFKNESKRRILGWVEARKVKTGKKRLLDIKTTCVEVAGKQNTESDGSRGFSDRC
tara:strand:+ start:145934 stop:146335 length:402 start_codon:yes stop_codon:yes gene_type:complete